MTQSAVKTNIHYWVQGQRADGTWQSLYCYRSEKAAKAIMRHLFDLGDEHPTAVKEELNTFGDFRVLAPE